MSNKKMMSRKRINYLKRKMSQSAAAPLIVAKGLGWAATVTGSIMPSRQASFTCDSRI
jgi:hypothetical protein